MSDKAEARIEAEFNNEYNRKKLDANGDQTVDVSIPVQNLPQEEIEEIDYVRDVIQENDDNIYRVYVSTSSNVGGAVSSSSTRR
jgi:hypothetical protein